MTTPANATSSASHAGAERALARAVAVASASAWVMLVLGVLSLAVSITSPWSPSFVISAVVIVNGWIERRFSRRLAARDPRAPRALALNQLALGVAIAVYAAWQSQAFTEAQIEHVLRRPFVAQILGAMDPAVVQEALAVLPQAVRILYGVVGAAAFVGCAATAAYYARQSRRLHELASPPAVPPESTPPAIPS